MSLGSCTEGNPPPTKQPPPSGAAAALLDIADLPEGFTPSSNEGPTPFRMCDRRFQGDPPGSERIGTRSFENPALGRIEQGVYTFADKGAPARYIDRVRKAAGRCQHFSAAGGRSYIVRIDERGGLAQHSVSITVGGQNGVPEATTVVLASKGDILVRMVDFGAGNPVELRLTQSLAIRALDPVGP
ncbi:MAG: hypothetical protein LC808_34445 [Actinobacteria bacterium]|nr:hypothetical protein [Actinomycetota bacterium]